MYICNFRTSGSLKSLFPFANSVCELQKSLLCHFCPYVESRKWGAARGICSAWRMKQISCHAWRINCMPQLMWYASHQITSKSNPLSQQLHGASLPSFPVFNFLIFLFKKLMATSLEGLNIFSSLWKQPVENSPRMSQSHLGSIFSEQGRVN